MEFKKLNVPKKAADSVIWNFNFQTKKCRFWNPSSKDIECVLSEVKVSGLYKISNTGIVGLRSVALWKHRELVIPVSHRGKERLDNWKRRGKKTYNWWWGKKGGNRMKKCKEWINRGQQKIYLTTSYNGIEAKSWLPGWPHQISHFLSLLLSWLHMTTHCP